MPRFAPIDLCQLASHIFAGAGASPDAAHVVANHLVEANLAGHDSHGVIRIPQYINAIDEGLVDPAATPEVVAESPAGAVMDGRRSPGQVTMLAAIKLAAERARQAGVGLVTARNLGHSGRLGAYTAYAAGEGLAALVMINSGGGGQMVAPFGGIAGRLATNPLSIGAPSNQSFAVVLDIATSVAPEGKMRVYYQRGLPVPAGWLIDHLGQPSTKPSDFYDSPAGALLPLGGAAGHKGYGLSFMIDILAGALSGAGCCRTPQPPSKDGVFVVAIDVGKFVPLEVFKAQVDGLVAHVKSCPTAPGTTEILVPGELEHRRTQERTRDGIEIEDATWQTIVEQAKRFGAAVPQPIAG